MLTIATLRQKSEDNLNAAELELEKGQATIAELQANLEDLQGIADEAAKLKDQVDECVQIKRLHFCLFL